MDAGMGIIYGIVGTAIGWYLGRYCRMRYGQILPTGEIRIVLLFVILAIIGFLGWITPDWPLIEGAMIIGVMMSAITYWKYQLVFIEVPSANLLKVDTVPISFYWKDGELYEHIQGLKASLTEMLGIRSRLDFGGFNPNDTTKDDEVGVRRRVVTTNNGMYWVTVESVVAISMEYKYIPTNFWHLGEKKIKNKVDGTVRTEPRYLLKDLPVSTRVVRFGMTAVEDQLTYWSQTNVYSAATRLVGDLRAEVMQLRSELDGNLGVKAAHIVKSLFDTGLDCTPESEDRVRGYVEKEIARRDELKKQQGSP